MFSDDKLVTLEEMLHSKVMEKEILNEELEHLVRQLEGVIGVNDDTLNDLIQKLGGWRRSKRVDGQFCRGRVWQSSVDGGDGGGNSKDQHEWQLGISFHQQDEVCQGCSGT